MADARRAIASLACCVLVLAGPALADPITRAQLLTRVDRNLLQSKHRIDPRLLSSLKLGALLSLDAVEPGSPSDGAQLVVRYVLTNFTLSSTRGIVSGLFQGLELVGVDGAAPSLVEMAAGGTALAADPSALLGQDSDVSEEKRFRRSDRYLNPLADVPSPGGDWARHGWAWDDVLGRRNVGLYGHVVPFRAVEPQTSPLRCPQSRSGTDSIEEWVLCAVDRGAETAQTWYKVEYWQFFGYSDSGQGFEIAHHEADWVTVQVLVDPATDELVQVHHFFHGRNASFDLRRNPGFVELEGGAVREHRGFNWGREVDFTWHEGPLARVKNELSAAHAQDNSVRLLKDPETGRFDHPVVYVENGAHEFWPTEAWSFQDAPNHDGDDDAHSYLAAAPPNLGEVEAPLAEVAEAPLILRYNGRWGAFSRKNDPPQGPALHDQWTWPASSSIRCLLDARLGR